MKNKLLFVGMLTMLLAFGVLVIGCLTPPYGPRDFDPELNGIWVQNNTDGEMLLILSNLHGAWETSGESYLGGLSVGDPNPDPVGRHPRGVYLPRDGVIKFQTTHIIFNVSNWHDGQPDGPRDIHRTQLPFVSPGNEYWDFEVTYTIIGDQLTFTRKNGSTITFTRRSNVPELTRTTWRSR